MAMNSFSSSQKNGADHWIALTRGPSTIDFVLGEVEEGMKWSVLVNELQCSFFIMEK